MKFPSIIMGLTMIGGCAGTSSTGSVADAPPSTTAPSQAEAESPTPAQQLEDTEQGREAPSIIGHWENASCGARKYRRQIRFLANEKFVATDEVAPCPPNAKCVWSGIVNWLGTWSLEGSTIAISPKPIKSGKLPLELPQKFIVLKNNPPSIGEKAGEIICPYRKKQ